MEKVTDGIRRPSKKEKINNALSDRLTDLINDKKDRGTTQFQQAQAIGIDNASLSKYSNGTTSPEATALYKMAEYYECSTDYLLGRTKIKNPDTANIKIGNLLGLSEKAIKYLKTWKDIEEEDSMVFALNCLFESGKAERFFKYLLLYFFTDAKEFQINDHKNNVYLSDERVFVTNKDDTCTYLELNHVPFIYKECVSEILAEIKQILRDKGIKNETNKQTSRYIQTKIKDSEV